MVKYNIFKWQDAKKLFQVCNEYEEDVNVIYENQIVDGKSFLGITTLMGHTVDVSIITDNNKIKEHFENKVKEL